MSDWINSCFMWKEKDDLIKIRRPLITNRPPGLLYMYNSNELFMIVLLQVCLCEWQAQHKSCEILKVEGYEEQLRHIQRKVQHLRRHITTPSTCHNYSNIMSPLDHLTFFPPMTGDTYNLSSAAVCTSTVHEAFVEWTLVHDDSTDLFSRQPIPSCSPPTGT